MDLFIGKVDINEDVCLRSCDKITNISNILTFFTVDFYNHETQHTTIIEG